MKIVTSILVSAALAAGCTHARDGGNAQRDADILRRNIETYTNAVNSATGRQAIALFARDIITSYPGVPDSTYQTLVDHYSRIGSDPNVKVQTRPDIEEILVSGDLGIVRVVWNTTVTTFDPPSTAKRQMKDLQVWRREPDGRWLFARGIHFRIPQPYPAP